jgi:putative membrane protein
MATDLTLAIAHHILVFGLVGIIMGEALLLRSGLGPGQVERIARLDRGYGITAGLVIVVGILRVIFGAKGYLYYVENPWFWAKMASFAGTALLSIRPTIRFLAWRRAAAADPAFLPPITEVQTQLGLLRAQAFLVVLVLVFAATMARFG